MNVRLAGMGFCACDKVRRQKTGLSNVTPFYLHFLSRPTPPKKGGTIEQYVPTLCYFAEAKRGAGGIFLSSYTCSFALLLFCVPLPSFPFFFAGETFPSNAAMRYYNIVSYEGCAQVTNNRTLHSAQQHGHRRVVGCESEASCPRWHKQ
jgi:hypothetical protein